MELEVLYPRFVKMFTSGETIPNFYRGGLKEELVKVSPYGPMVSEEAKKKADEVKAALMADYVIFKGPIADKRAQPSSRRRRARPDRPNLEKMSYLVEASSRPLREGRCRHACCEIGLGEFLRLPFRRKARRRGEYVVIPVLALLASLVFGIFVASFGNPIDLYFYMYQGAFGTWFSWQNTLTRAAPLILTALCTALPAQLGMVIIGGEGALLIGALCATSAALAMPAAPPLVVDVAMAIAGMIGGGLAVLLAGRCASFAASTKRFRACCWSISRSPSSTSWSKARCAIRPA